MKIIKMSPSKHLNNNSLTDSDRWSESVEGSKGNNINNDHGGDNNNNSSSSSGRTRNRLAVGQSRRKIHAAGEDPSSNSNSTSGLTSSLNRGERRDREKEQREKDPNKPRKSTSFHVSSSERKSTSFHVPDSRHNNDPLPSPPAVPSRKSTSFHGAAGPTSSRRLVASSSKRQVRNSEINSTGVNNAANYRPAASRRHTHRDRAASMSMRESTKDSRESHLNNSIGSGSHALMDSFKSNCSDVSKDKDLVGSGGDANAGGDSDDKGDGQKSGSNSAADAAQITMEKYKQLYEAILQDPSSAFLFMDAEKDGVHDGAAPGAEETSGSGGSSDGEGGHGNNGGNGSGSGNGKKVLFQDGNNAKNTTASSGSPKHHAGDNTSIIEGGVKVNVDDIIQGLQLENLLEEKTTCSFENSQSVLSHVNNQELVKVTPTRRSAGKGGSNNSRNNSLHMSSNQGNGSNSSINYKPEKKSSFYSNGNVPPPPPPARSSKNSSSCSGSSIVKRETAKESSITKSSDGNRPSSSFSLTPENMQLEPTPSRRRRSNSFKFSNSNNDDSDARSIGSSSQKSNKSSKSHGSLSSHRSNSSRRRFSFGNSSQAGSDVGSTTSDGDSCSGGGGRENTDVVGDLIQVMETSKKEKKGLFRKMKKFVSKKVLKSEKSKFDVGDRARYITGKGKDSYESMDQDPKTVDVIIVGVHIDAVLMIPYYTILLPNGSKKQTDMERLLPWKEGGSYPHNHGPSNSSHREGSSHSSSGGRSSSRHRASSSSRSSSRPRDHHSDRDRDRDTDRHHHSSSNRRPSGRMDDDDRSQKSERSSGSRLRSSSRGRHDSHSSTSNGGGGASGSSSRRSSSRARTRQSGSGHRRSPSPDNNGGHRSSGHSSSRVSSSRRSGHSSSFNSSDDRRSSSHKSRSKSFHESSNGGSRTDSSKRVSSSRRLGNGSSHSGDSNQNRRSCHENDDEEDYSLRYDDYRPKVDAMRGGWSNGSKAGGCGASVISDCDSSVLSSGNISLKSRNSANFASEAAAAVLMLRSNSNKRPVIRDDGDHSTVASAPEHRFKPPQKKSGDGGSSGNQSVNRKGTGGNGKRSSRSTSGKGSNTNNSNNAKTSSSSSSNTKKPKKNSSDPCDKCDGKHATSKCPSFSQDREKHKDAWRNYGPNNHHIKSNETKVMGEDIGNYLLPTSQCKLVTMPGDGNCLFHSLVYGINAIKKKDSSSYSTGGSTASNSMNAKELRREIAAYIAANPNLPIADAVADPDLLKEWVLWDSGKSVKEYADGMAIGGWGGGVEIAACSHLFDVNVHVYEVQPGNKGNYLRIACFNAPAKHGKSSSGGSSSSTLNVLYQGRKHYDALIVSS